METIVKVISFFIAAFVILGGCWIILTPPYGDEPQGYVIIAAGIFIPLITLTLGKMTESRID